MFQEIQGRHARAAVRLAGLTLFLCLFAAQPATAQDGVTSYPAAFFAANQPATAYDMVSLLPGFRPVNGDSNVRGFSGTVGNVLIDGQLPTSKEDSAETLLRRITAASVESIELIRGGADMHGYPVLANVVRKQSSNLRARVEVGGAVTHYGDTEDKLGLHLTRQGATSIAEFSANWSRDYGDQNGYGTRQRFLPNGAPLQLSNYDFPQATNNSGASASYRQPVWIGDLSVGVAYKQQRVYSDVNERIYFPAVSTVSGRESKLQRNGEGLLDYKFPLKDWGQVQVFGVHRITEQDEISQTTNAAGVTNRSRGLFNQREDVARLAWNYGGAVKLQAGVEGSINVLASRSSLTQAGKAVILPASNIRLEEKRVEFFSSAIWRIDPSLMTEMGARYESSSLTQSGDSTLTKQLGFFKPRWLTTWNFAPGQELRLLLERHVGQLVFRNFASSTSLNGDTVNGGNKNLVPARSWNMSLAWEWHFWKRGSVVAEAKREFITNVVDFIPVFAGTQVFNAVGNIGNGVRDGITTEVILPLDELGLTGLTLTGQANLHHSRVRDPATGMFRQIVGGQTVSSVQFVTSTAAHITYDMPAYNLQLGADLHTHLQAHEADYRIDEIDPAHHHIKLGLFVEYKPTPDWTLRLFDRDVMQTSSYRDRYVYSGLRGTAPLSYIEYRRLDSGAVMGLNIQHDL